MEKKREDILMSTLSAQTASQEDVPQDDKSLGLNERLALIGLIEEGIRLGSTDSPIVADLFSELWELVNRTVSGAKIDRLKPQDGTKGFQVFEINAETGENLGRLHMLYLKKPIPCYYLVYVEVAPPFRNHGLGHRILAVFKSFLEEKSAVGVLDNIIPNDDPTFDIYVKHDWSPAFAITGSEDAESDGVYMVYVPSAFRDRELKEPVTRLLHHLKRKRPAIDMRENELMVGRTIAEFKELYSALIGYFRKELDDGEPNLLMNFMFTRFVTKLLGFSHGIGQLLGYTGGESLGQIVLDPAVKTLPVQSYAPRELASNPSFVDGDTELWLKLGDTVKNHPARVIESLPNYRRPSLVAWMESRGRTSSHTLTIGDLMDIGFDPTRLKEIEIDGEEYIFERVQARIIRRIERKRLLFQRLASQLAGRRIRQTLLMVNPPLVVIRDRGNGYVLRKKVPGIHWEEAVEQLQTSPSLADLNQSMRVDRMITSTVSRATEMLAKLTNGEAEDLIPCITFFVPWNLESNQPKIAVDFSSQYIESIWIA